MKPWEVDAHWYRWSRLKHSHPWNNTLLSTCAACRAVIRTEVGLWPRE